MLVEALAEHLPETIEVDISPLKIGGSIRVMDMKLENVDFLNNSNDVIVAVKTARTAIKADEDEESSEEGSTGDVSDETSANKDAE